MVKTIELVIFMDMSENKLVELIKRKVSNKVFKIDSPFYDMESVIPSLEFKIDVVGQKDMITVGEWKPYIIYDMYIYPLEGNIPSLTNKFQETLEDVIKMAKEQNILIKDVGGIFTRILRLSDTEVSNFTRIFGMGNADVRNIYFIQDNKINESYILEGMDEDKLVKFINNKIKNKVFEIKDPISGLEHIVPEIDFKVEIVGQKDMITVGEWREYLVYDMYIYPLKNPNNSKYIEILEETLRKVAEICRKKNIRVQDWDFRGSYGGIISLANIEIKKFTKIFDSDYVTVRDVYFIDDKKINEGYITEAKYDGATRTLVRDIIDVYKKNDEGEFSLPEDFSEDEITYDFGDGLDFITIELEITKDETIDDFFVDGEIYYQDDQQTIIIQIIYNPKLKYKIIENLIGELNDTVRHEIEHIKQHQRGDKFPKEPKKQITYYTQKHQVEALIKGFKRRAKVERRPVEDVMRSWFQKYKVRHNLTDSQVEKVITKLLTYSS